MLRSYVALGIAMILATSCAAVNAMESIEFVAEHLPEIAMDNRYASLPLWNACDGQTSGDAASADPGAASADEAEDTESESCWGVNAGYARTHSGTMSIDGPMIALSVSRPLATRYRLTGLLFFDDLSLAGGVEQRPLDVLFANPP